ncbi:MAG: hypothetical protein GY927_00840 [bacterium]|nr:hypothetical protein [bacterium]
MNDDPAPERADLDTRNPVEAEIKRNVLRGWSENHARARATAILRAEGVKAFKQRSARGGGRLREPEPEPER